MRILNVCFIVFCSIAAFGQGQDTISFTNHTGKRAFNRSDTTRMVMSPEGG